MAVQIQNLGKLRLSWRPTADLGYGARDFFYYKMRSGNAVATLKDIDREAGFISMIQSNARERELRIVLSSDEMRERTVAITPIKTATNTSPDEDMEDDDSIDAYKDWLSYMHDREQAMELGDTTREETVETYKKWLRVEGKLDEINAYLNLSPQINVHSSQDSNDRSPVQRPSHARRSKQQGNGIENTKKRRRGTLKGLKAINKRARAGNQKLQIEFSRLGGPVGQRYGPLLKNVTQDGGHL
ncbi:hypothetical protein PVAP13_4NG207922 [Panicum virgatum]|uniref:Uncharacterized protein n=1 Tax=Panicum virgatum TaxID=38727 RepID=A0A8T0TCG6_PANVG|nr:hypothetical protein PVAP13_4NG207922 [Panicum virgatum]